MTAPTPVLIARALTTTLRTALASLEVPVERDRDAAVTLDDLPRVLVFTDGTSVETDFVGGAQLRVATFGVEMLDGPQPGEADGSLADRVATLRERVHAALMANRTLGGACLGLFVEATGEARSDLMAARVRAEVMRVSCYFAG